MVIDIDHNFLCDCQVLAEAAAELGIKHHASGTAVTIEGPRLSTKAESLLFKSWGAHIINMTTVPEVKHNTMY